MIRSRMKWRLVAVPVAGFAVVVLAVAALARPAAALVLQYTYTGNAFTVASSPLSTADKISGWFKIDCGSTPAADCKSLSYGNYTAAVTDFSFMAGSLTAESPEWSFNLSFQTNSTAQPEMWSFSAGRTIDGVGFPVKESLGSLKGISPPLLCSDCDLVLLSSFSGFTILGANESPGTWTVSDPGSMAAVPLPAALPILLAGLGGLGFAGWRSNRRAA